MSLTPGQLFTLTGLGLGRGRVFENITKRRKSARRVTPCSVLYSGLSAQSQTPFASAEFGTTLVEVACRGRFCSQMAHRRWFGRLAVNCRGLPDAAGGVVRRCAGTHPVPTGGCKSWWWQWWRWLAALRTRVALPAAARPAVSIRRGWRSPGKVWGVSAGVWLRSRTGARWAQRTLEGVGRWPPERQRAAAGQLVGGHAQRAGASAGAEKQVGVRTPR